MKKLSINKLFLILLVLFINQSTIQSAEFNGSKNNNNNNNNNNNYKAVTKQDKLEILMQNQLAKDFPLTFVWLSKVLKDKKLPAEIIKNILVHCQSNTKLKLKATLNHQNPKNIIQLQNKDLASSSYDGIIMIWRNINNEWQCIQILTGHKDSIISLIQLDNGYLASASNDDTIKIWRNTDDEWQCIDTLIGHKDSIIYLIQLDNGDLASVSRDNTIKIWRNTNDKWQCIDTLVGHENNISCLIQLDNGDLASADDEKVNIWHYSDNKWNCIKTLDTSSDIYSNNSNDNLIQLDNYLVSLSGHMINILQKVIDIKFNSNKNLIELEK